MKLLADVHISPRTVRFLRDLGHDVVRSDEVLPANAADEEHWQAFGGDLLGRRALFNVSFGWQ